MSKQEEKTCYTHQDPYNVWVFCVCLACLIAVVTVLTAPEKEKKNPQESEAYKQLLTRVTALEEEFNSPRWSEVWIDAVRTDTKMRKVFQEQFAQECATAQLQFAKFHSAASDAERRLDREIEAAEKRLDVVYAEHLAVVIKVKHLQRWIRDSYAVADVPVETTISDISIADKPAVHTPKEAPSAHKETEERKNTSTNVNVPSTSASLIVNSPPEVYAPEAGRRTVVRDEPKTPHESGRTDSESVSGVPSLVQEGHTGVAPTP